MNRKVFMGCGGIAAFLCVATVILVVFWVPRMTKKAVGWATTKLADYQQQAAHDATWQPASPTLDASWFAPSLEPWQLDAAKAVPALADLNIERPAFRADYHKGSRTINVAILKAPEAERETLMANAKGVVEKGTPVTKTSGNATITYNSGGSLWTTRMGHRMTIHKDDQCARIWWLNGWLFIFRGSDETALDLFAEKFVNAAAKQELEAP